MCGHMWQFYTVCEHYQKLPAVNICSNFGTTCLGPPDERTPMDMYPNKPLDEMCPECLRIAHAPNPNARQNDPYRKQDQEAREARERMEKAFREEQRKKKAEEERLAEIKRQQDAQAAAAKRSKRKKEDSPSEAQEKPKRSKGGKGKKKDERTEEKPKDDDDGNESDIYNA
ncbi:hypothetical protein B0T20DRAFT_134567 [Sordaria brevicollis]|uniref:Uncharacterized protein n=1 Tax=Sordaria brevicollis TaxID=83679 RepID=A0AAE0PLN8_SORBR|nr:hypothetical protein B0T20DRAFT_134567 [Sordaria brevicollis]